MKVKSKVVIYGWGFKNFNFSTHFLCGSGIFNFS